MWLQAALPFRNCSAQILLEEMWAFPYGEAFLNIFPDISGLRKFSLIPGSLHFQAAISPLSAHTEMQFLQQKLV